MDGRSVNSLHIKKNALAAIAAMLGRTTLLAVAAMLMPPQPAQAQAMGKVSVDSGMVAPEGIAPAPATPAAPPRDTAAEASAPTQTPLDPPKPAATEPTIQLKPEQPAITAPALAPIPAPAAATAPAPAMIVQQLPAPGPTSQPADQGLQAAAKPAAPAKAPEPQPAAHPEEIKAPAPTASIENDPIVPGRNHAAAPADGTKSALAATDNAKATSDSPTAGWYAQLKGLAQVVGALAVVVGLIFILKGLAKKFVPGAKSAGGKGVIEVLARHAIAKNQAIVLVRIGSQIVAINQGKESSESVLVISDAAEVAKIIGQIEGKKPQSSQAGFTRLLANARVDLETEPGAEPDLSAMSPENLDEQLEEMAAAKRQLMELRQHVRSVRDRLPQS